jgi:hypothetical protein
MVGRMRQSAGNNETERRSATSIKILVERMKELVKVCYPNSKGGKSMFKKIFSVFFIGLFGLIFLINSQGSLSTVAAMTPWDWAGIIGTGQSLAVGTTPILSTTQPYHNLRLSLGNLTVPPYDPNNSSLTMAPLTERVNATGYPAPYPNNLYGETPHTAMGNQISSMALTNLGVDYITAHTIVGESGQGMSVICKGATDTGSTGRAYAATLFEVSAIKRLATASNKTYGVGAIIITHGETDAGNTSYESRLYQLWSDYNQDLRAITGQSQPIPLLVSQQHAYPSTSGTSASTLAQWKIGVDYPGVIICTGPKYQYSYQSDGIHLINTDYQQLGEKYGEVYYEKVIRGNDWQPLQPMSAEQSGRVITVNFHVPVLPLVWNNTLPSPNQSALTEWRNGKGFEVSASGTRITISSVEILNSSVRITCASDLPASGVKVGYAFTTGGAKRTNGTVRWGLLRDSDPFKGSTTGIAQPNYCVAFEVAVPYNTSASTPTPTPISTVTPTPTPSVTVTPTPANCSVTYTQNDWGSGATVSITIKNNGTSAIDGWNLAWNFPDNQKITNLWNGSYTQSGTSVTVTNLSYNSRIPAGGTVNFGFNISYSGTNAKPTSFMLNGTVCEVL